jgi:hypothetical protein
VSEKVTGISVEKFYLCKFCLIVFGVLLAVQNVMAQPAKNLLDITLQCREIDRISISPEGQMQPAHPGRSVNIKVEKNLVVADGVFFGDTYEIDQLVNGDFRGNGRANTRTEVFHFSDGFLFHTAILKNKKSQVIQSQILSCTSNNLSPP